MPRIVIDNASVSYFLRQHGKFNVKNDAAGATGAIGATVFQRRNYLEIAALRDVSLTIEDGDRVGLIGINGSGKSTLLKLCAGALATQAGSIRIEGKVNPQFSLGAGIRATLTGRRNAELKCLYMGVPQRGIAARIEEVRELSGLGQYFELPVSSYSAGMRSRLTMGLLKLVRADILVMDEWIGVADRTVTETANKLRADLIESTSIFVVASHSEAILRDWTTRLVWLANGYVKMIGPTEDVLAAYNETKGV